MSFAAGSRGSNQRTLSFVYPMTPRHESPFLFIYKLIGLQTGATLQPFGLRPLVGLGLDFSRKLLNSLGLAIC